MLRQSLNIHPAPRLTPQPGFIHAPFSTPWTNPETALATVIGVSGGSGSGKTTFSKKLVSLISSQWDETAAVILSQDSYYLDQADHFDGDGGSVNFDHPSSIDFELLAQHLQLLKKGFSVEVPQYNFSTHRRETLTERLQPARVIIVDGTLILSQEMVRRQLDVSVFIDVPEDVRFERRLRRDVAERGRQPEGIRKQFFGQVKPMHDLFIQPSLAHASWRLGHELDTSSQIQRELLALLH